MLPVPVFPTVGIDALVCNTRPITQPTSPGPAALSSSNSDMLNSGSRPAFQVATKVAVAIVAIWSLTAAFLWQQYEWSMETGARSIRHLSFVMAELVEQSLTVNQLVLESMLDWVAEEGVSTEEQYRGIASSRMFFDRLVGRTTKLPTIDVGTFIAADGTVLNFTRSYPPPPINLADRDYFVEQMGGNQPPFSLGSAVQNRGTGKWNFYLAKDVQGRDSSKLGVVITGAGVDFFADLFRRMLRDYEGDATTQGDAAFLFRKDGILLAATSDYAPLGSQVFPNGDKSNKPRRLADATIDLGLPTNSLSSSADLTTFPAYVLAVTNPSRYLLEWRQTAWAMVAAGVVLSMLSMGIGRRSYNLLQARDRVLRQEGERRVLSAIFASPLALAAVVTPDRRVLYCNSAFSASLAPVIRDGTLVYAPEMDVGGAFTALLNGDDSHADFTLRIHGKDCSAAYLRFSGARVDLGQGDDEIALLGYDDTQRMRSEAHIIQSSKLITLGEMATGMAHELNQPLNVIKMAAQSALFEFEDIGEPQADSNIPPIVTADSDIFIQARLRRVVEQVDRAATIIDHMRIFGRVRQGPPPLIEAVATCRSALQLIGHQLRDSQVNVSLRSGEGPQLVKCHPVLLEQVLVNLLLNARDATVGVALATRKVDIEVRGTEHEVIIIVSDNGHGIPSRLRDRVFEPFFTTKSAEKGTGLGLSVSYGIIRDSGGKLELLDSAHGCAFQITFPAVAEPEPQTR